MLRVYIRGVYRFLCAQKLRNDFCSSISAPYFFNLSKAISKNSSFGTPIFSQKRILSLSAPLAKSLALNFFTVLAFTSASFFEGITKKQATSKSEIASQQMKAFLFHFRSNIDTRACGVSRQKIWGGMEVMSRKRHKFS